MSTQETSPVLERLFAAIENDEIRLPAMPDLALKIQNMLDDMNVSTQQIVAIVATDPVLSSQIIKTANSALYAGKPQVDTLMAAVSRIGYKMLRNIIITFSMNKMSNATHPAVKKHIADFWAHSKEVAAISYVLSKNHRHLNPDQAMMAGLIHDIGTLPLCLHAEKMVSNLDEAILDSLSRRFRAIIGNRLLLDWSFPTEITEVVLIHEDLHYDPESSTISYADVVTVANLLKPATTKIVNWDDVAAAKRMFLSKETCQSFFDIFKGELSAARGMFI
ncbi:HDOD domain-containing protein [Sideroxydans sp.]